MKKIGFIINPIAGLGGRAGFKGSDQIEHQQKALASGYQKLSPQRARTCLEQLSGLNDCCFLAPPGELGADLLTSMELVHQTIELESLTNTGEDTLKCVQIFTEESVDLILFCGGDGTARDICSANTANIPVLGIPAGVKMYSGCFSVNPRIAGDILKKYILERPTSIELREVMDIDEKILGTHDNSPKLYGYLPTLNEGAKLQGSKVASSSTFQEAESLAAYRISQMLPDTLYIIGPGSTTYKIKELLGIDGTLLGVDVVRNRLLLAKDADEKKLLALIEKYDSCEIIVTCIGGAGFVFGRGNQQISASVIQAVGKGNIRLAVTKSKLAGLWQRPMLVDTGDSKIDDYLSGYYRIEFNEKESAVYRIGK